MGRGYSHLQLDIVSFKWWGSGKMNLCSDLSMISTWTEPLFCPGKWKWPRIREIWQPPSSQNVDLLAKKLSELWKAIEITWSYYQSQTHAGVLKPCRGVLQSCRGSYGHAEGSCCLKGGALWPCRIGITSDSGKDCFESTFCQTHLREKKIHKN